jgi:hypothetical protein
MNEENPMVLLELKLKRYITAEGEMQWLMETPEKYSPLDAIGLLFAGILRVSDEMSKNRRDEQ